MKSKKILGLLLSATMVVGMLAGCGGGDDGGSNNDGGNVSNPGSDNQGGGSSDDGGNDVVDGDEGEPVNTTPFWQTLDPETSGSVDVMCWSGDSQYYQDIGHMEMTEEDLHTTINVAMVYAMAKKFNETYPNIKINLYAKEGDPDGNDITWDQELENFRAEHGKYPDVYASTMLANDVAKGMVADLSVYADDPLYQTFNKSVMNMMNYYGFQAGIPQFMQPWGIYVNKELAEDNNIDVPNYDWDIDDYTDFILSADNKTFWGAINTDIGGFISLIDTGVNTIIAQMNAYSGSGDRVNVASDEVMSMLDYFPKWAQSEMWTAFGKGEIDESLMGTDGWWWGYRIFCRNNVLTYSGDPWMLSLAAKGRDPETGEFPQDANIVESDDWDIYPRPATPYRGNTVGLVLDPMAVHNYAMDDGNPEWSDEEKAKLDVSYAFASYWCGSTESLQARADQTYWDNDVEMPAMNDTFPLVTGKAFDDQMAIWYSIPSHQRYGDANLMPGFQYVMELWEQGQFWDVSDKAYPYYVYEDGTRKTCIYEWENIMNADVVGVGVTEASWVDTVKSLLPDWNVKINERFEQAEQELRAGLKEFYGFTDADF